MGDAPLIRRWSPCLRYDSAESFFADSAATFAENGGADPGAVGNVLKRGRSGEVIAAVKPTGGGARLSLDFLGPGSYPDGAAVRAADTLDATASNGQHARDARALRADPRYANRTYGRLAHEGGSRWLQYWFFYFHNDPWDFLNISVHEGDWEMIQLRLDDEDRPDSLTFAQHGYGSTWAWSDIETTPVKDAEVPVIYVARGSHASYARAGRYWKALDVADGGGEMVRPAVEIIDDEAPAWVAWPGRWGSSRTSPSGPRWQPRWASPSAFHREGLESWRAGVDDPAQPRPLPPVPEISARRLAGGGEETTERLEVTYRTPAPAASEDSAASVVIAVTARDGMPADTEVFPARRRRTTVSHQAVLDPNKRYEVRAFSVTAGGVMGTLAVSEADPTEATRRISVDGLEGAATGTGFLLEARPDVADFRDLEFRPTLVEVPPERALAEHLARGVAVRDQHDDGPCTGFALACVVDTLLRERDGDVNAGDVVAPASARMLYAMAQRNDAWKGESYSGSSARGAMKGWHKLGVCSRDLWPDDSRDGELSETRVLDAGERPLGAYLRVNKRDLVALHAALAEVGVLFATARVHRGWMEVDADGRIPAPHHQGDAEMLGGHAFAIVGYDREGFWVQNSWGEGWGLGGHAHLSYDDWLDSVMDAWVARLAVPVELTSPGGTSARRVLARSNRYTHDELRPHVVSVGNDGRPGLDGVLGNSRADIRRIISSELRAVTDSWDVRRVLLYAHGGVVDEDAALRWIARQRPRMLRQGVYPLSFVWRTDFVTTLSSMLEDAGLAKGAGAFFGRARGYLQDRIDDLLEPAARAGGVKSLWDEMKENALLASSGEEGAASAVAEELGRLPRSGPPLEVHLAAHSAGSILLAPMVALLGGARDLGAWASDDGPGMATCSLWAPACTMELFQQTYLPALTAGDLGHLDVYALDDASERRDSVGPAYRKSVLYLVSNALESRLRSPGERNGVPLLGMEAFAAREAALRRHNADLFIAPGTASATTSHSSFDDDRKTIDSTLGRILG